MNEKIKNNEAVSPGSESTGWEELQNFTPDKCSEPTPTPEPIPTPVPKDEGGNTSIEATIDQQDGGSTFSPGYYIDDNSRSSSNTETPDWIGQWASENKEKTMPDPELKKLLAQVKVDHAKWGLSHNNDGTLKEEPKHRPSRAPSFELNREVAKRFGQEQVEKNKELGVDIKAELRRNKSA